MRYENLSETVAIKTISETDTEGIFEVDGLYTGYGVTIGNALRRVLLSSLPGAAITHIKVRGLNHEFSAIPGVSEDMVEISLNLKRVRFRMHTEEPQVLRLKVKGEKKATAADIETNASVDVITTDAHIATLTAKSAELDMEITVERGLGYVPVDARKAEKLPIGVIAVDAIFSPVVKVNFVIENMRVGDRTDYNKLRLVIETDGSIAPSQALQKASKTLEEYFSKVGLIPVKEAAAPKPEPKKKAAAKTTKKK